MARFRDTLLRLLGSSSGETILKAAATASGTITLPAGTTDFSATGGTSQVVKQAGSGAAFTVGQLAQSDISGTLAPDHGGTGIANNAASTITISGNFGTTFTVTAATNSTLPSGTHTLAGLDVVQTWSANQQFNDGNFLLNGATSGTLTLKATAIAGSNTITFPAATDTVDLIGTAQTFTAAKTFNSGNLKLAGATSGTITVNAATVAGANTITLPAGTTNFSATGGANQFVGQASAGAAFTVAKPTTAVTGDTSGGNATAGDIGEYVNSVIPDASAISLTSTVSTNITSISLTAGDWDVEGTVFFRMGAAGVLVAGTTSISTVSATLVSGTSGAEGLTKIPYGSGSSNLRVENACPATRVVVNSTTTVFLVTSAEFNSSTVSGYGNIRARRMR